MNKLFLTMVFCAGIITANAQPSYNAASANGIPSRNGDNEEIVAVSLKDPLAAVDFSLKNKIITFTGLPADKHLRVYITNADGEEEYNKKLSADNSTINVSKLDKGLHYITILSKDNKRKGFRINL
jgi:hypothetical protein